MKRFSIKRKLPKTIVAPVQPEKDETILTCGHVRGPNDDAHWLFFPDGGVTFTRGDGTTGSARFGAQCNRCFLRDATEKLESNRRRFRADHPYPGGKLMIAAPERN